MSAYKKLKKKRDNAQMMDNMADMVTKEEQPPASNSDSSDAEDTVPSKRQKVEDSDSKDSSDSDKDSGEKDASSSSDQENAPEIDPEDELRAFKDPDALSKDWKNRQRVLMVTQRSIEG